MSRYWQVKDSKPRIMFIGTSKFGLHCLDLIISSNLYNVVGVLTAPKVFPISYRPEGLYNTLHGNVKNYCEKKNINCMVIKQGMNDPDLFEKVEALSPELFIVVGWYHIIPKFWLRLAPTFGLHASLLPDYSGGAPLVWAVINGESSTGITLYKLSEGVDDGPIIAQIATDIHYDDTISTLYSRIESLGLKLLESHLPQIVDGSVKLQDQDNSQRKVYPQRSPEDGNINWSLSAEQIYNFVRAQTKPYPGAFTYFDKDKTTIWSSRVYLKTFGQVLSPSKIKVSNQQVLVGCGKGSILEITDIAINGKDISAYEWWCQQVESENDHGFSMNICTA